MTARALGEFPGKFSEVFRFCPTSDSGYLPQSGISPLLVDPDQNVTDSCAKRRFHPGRMNLTGSFDLIS